MRRRYFTSLLAVTVALSAQAPVLPAFAASDAYYERDFDASMDAFSVPTQTPSFAYSVKQEGSWSSWTDVESDGDTAPGEESELIMLPQGTTALRVRGIASPADIHAFAVSHEPAKLRTASTATLASTAVMTRTEWGADSSYLYPGVNPDNETPISDASKGDNGAGTGQTDQRVKDCMQAQADHPDEFQYASVAKKDSQGKSYLWPLQYSKSVRMIVVHHAALLIKDDPRPAVERVRAIYKYHALTKGWGDIGYHYVIDEAGQVYEGRQGGKYVVGGHAYCNNVGTVGIVLLGNFDIEQPSQKQVKSLQWLLADLAKSYGIDPKKSVQFHGKKFEAPIVRHRDLLSTACPGYYLSEAFQQVIQHVQTGQVDAPVAFPAAPGTGSIPPPAPPPPGFQEGISFTGRTSIAINPGGKQRLSFAFTAGREGAYEGKRVADVRISDPRITLMVDDGRNWIPVTKGILLQSDLPAYESANLQLVVQAPMDAGTYSMDIGGIHFTVSVFGRRARTGDFVSPFTAETMTIVKPRVRTPSSAVVSKIRPQSRQLASSSVASSLSSSAQQSLSSAGMIRIKLSASTSPVLRFSDRGAVDGKALEAGEVSLLLRSGSCEAQRGGVSFASGPILRFTSGKSGVMTVDQVRTAVRSYRGTLECRVVDGTLVLINELPLEEYMMGVAEEPDTEPHQKQRAFAIAARTYAAFYAAGSNRKFPGMPYDGSDDPAIFQLYVGVGNEASNPRWLEAVASTTHQVLRYQGKLMKPPYFSEDDGRTRSPAEAGWKNFPAAEILQSKSDPWCNGMTLRGHGVGMSGCGAEGQANEGRSAEQILQYYYPGARITDL